MVSSLMNHFSSRWHSLRHPHWEADIFHTNVYFLTFPLYSYDTVLVSFLRNIEQNLFFLGTLEWIVVFILMGKNHSPDKSINEDKSNSSRYHYDFIYFFFLLTNWLLNKLITCNSKCIHAFKWISGRHNGMKALVGRLAALHLSSSSHFHASWHAAPPRIFQMSFCKIHPSCCLARGKRKTPRSSAKLPSRLRNKRDD